MSAVGEFPKSGKCRNLRSGATWDYAKDGASHVRVFNGPPGSAFADRTYAVADFTSRFMPIGPCIVEAGVYKDWVKALPEVFPSARDAEKAVEQAINDDATGVWELRVWRLSFV